MISIKQNFDYINTPSETKGAKIGKAVGFAVGCATAYNAIKYDTFFTSGATKTSKAVGIVALLAEAVIDIAFATGFGKAIGEKLSSKKQVKQSKEVNELV